MMLHFRANIENHLRCDGVEMRGRKTINAMLYLEFSLEIVLYMESERRFVLWI